MNDPVEPLPVRPPSLDPKEMVPPPSAPPLTEVAKTATTDQATPASEEDRDRLGTLSSAIESLEEVVASGIAEILGEFREKLALDRFKEDHITTLHEELQRHKNDLVSHAARQILQGIVCLHDSMGKVVAFLRQKPPRELTLEKFFNQLQEFQDDVELLLGQHGVEKFQVDEEDFDPRRQTALRTIPTEDPKQVGRVAEHLRPGFVQGDRLLQKERVAVYVTMSQDAQEEQIS